jgi:RNA polymerase sigma-70 factor (ECF subfamily)
MAAIRDVIERQLSFKQQQVLRALVFEGVPLDVVVRHWGSNRNAVYKVVHDARRKLKKELVARGFDVEEFLGVSRPTRGRRRSMTSAAPVHPLRVAA